MELDRKIVYLPLTHLEGREIKSEYQAHKEMHIMMGWNRAVDFIEKQKEVK